MITLKDPSVAEHYDVLPQGLKTAIAGSGWEASMQQISTDNHLHIDQADIIGTEVVLVMIGLADAAEFYNSIQEEARIEPALAEKITMEVNEKIFQKIRVELIELYKGREASGEQQSENDEIESREELLAEIEKPGEVKLGLSRIPGSVKTEPPPEAAKSETPEEKAAETSEPAIPPPPPPPGPVPIFAKKLGESISGGMQEKTMQPVLAPKSEPKKYSADPYREPPTA